MRNKRHQKLGIKQTIQKVWMDKTVQMMLAGFSEKEIRHELDEYLLTQKQSGGIGERGEEDLWNGYFAPSFMVCS